MRSLVLFTVFLLFSVCVDAAAQEDGAYRLTREQRDLLAQQLRINPRGRHMQRIELAAQMPGEVNFARSDDGEVRVVKHLRGKEGIPLPAHEEFLKNQQLGQEHVQALHDALQAQTRAELEMIDNPPQLPECRESITQVNRFEDSGGGQSEVVMDMLFLAADQVPLDAKEVFGEDVQIMPYATNASNPLAPAAASLGVTCLPYRVRVTSRAAYAHAGRDALKNYSEDPDGQGKLDPRALGGMRSSAIDGGAR